MIVVQLWIPGEPVAKERARVTRSGHSYTPDKTAKAEADIGWLLRQTYPSMEPATTTLFGVQLGFKLKSGSRRDLDNLIKTCLDACNGLVWVDDSQVWRIEAEKVRVAEEPGTWLTIERLTT